MVISTLCYCRKVRVPEKAGTYSVMINYISADTRLTSPMVITIVTNIVYGNSV